MSDVEVGDGDNVAMMRVDTDEARVPSMHTTDVQERPTEMLRYYSMDGGFAHTPLLHFQPFAKGYLSAVCLKDTVKFDECFWCRRAFPKGMRACTLCLAMGNENSYCSKKCQLAARAIHVILVHEDGQEKGRVKGEIPIEEMEEID